MDPAEAAAATDGYSGADLQAIVSEAQLNVVLEYIDGVKQQVEAAGGTAADWSQAAGAATPQITREVRASAERACCFGATVRVHCIAHAALACGGKGMAV